MDTSVFAHEYTHLISNRMAGGPDSGLTGYQAIAMGESWSDLDAMEYQFENNYLADPFVIGAYATGNPKVGIRGYAVDKNPLNYSDLGSDTPGPEEHADGEIWNGTNYTVRQALVDKYNASYPYGDLALQKSCADGNTSPGACPGNRRWIQIMYDAWLLQPATVSMLGARDTYLAADVMRFGGANQTELWRGFAQRGMGTGAVTNANGDHQATPSFESPAEPNATVTFNAVAAEQGNASVPAKVYVGRYEARAMPIADTDSGTPLANTAKFVPGTYEFIVQAPGYGLSRFTQTFTATATTVTFKLQTNWASSTKGASITGDGTAAELGKLIDDTENTNWTATGRMPSVAGHQCNRRARRRCAQDLERPRQRDDRRRPVPLHGASEVRDRRMQRGDGRLLRRGELHPRLHERGRRLPGHQAAAGRVGPVDPDVRPADRPSRPRTCGSSC